ncbi:DNA repair protein RecN [Clostridium sp.]|uniref:DNA repair protein RecN n=1 Tax=Clostridium sp. TaxID=1506 RepID=UPI002FCBC470
MLLQLNIKNFALIENLSIDFQQGFNVLSGETGAGKSILIDAINFVLGGKFNKNLIRIGEDKTVVEAVFSIKNDRTKNVLNELEITYDDLVILSRESFQSGKTVAKVNGKTLLLSKIKCISETLLDIHGQHENQNLLDNNNHIIYVDSFGEVKLKDVMKEYKEHYEQLSLIQNKIYELQGEGGAREKNIDYLKYQIDEINNVNPNVGEDEELEEKFSMLSNAEKIEKSLAISYKLLKDSDEERSSVMDSLTHIIRELRSIEKHKEKIKNIADSLQDVYYLIQQNTDEVRDIKDNIYYDENELDYINSRIYQLSNCKKKYGETIKDVLKYKEEIQIKHDELINSTVIIEKLQSDRKNIITNMKLIASKIHEIRCEISIDLEEKVKKELDYVGLDKSTFKIDIKQIEELMQNGNDKVQFIISTNPGQPLEPLEEIVSGGELSRIMLALKTVFVDKDEIPSVIFDEIDTGISGRIAQRVAEKMFLISKNHQVFCVTHLPQIATMADINYLIEKQWTEDTTFTKVKRLSFKEVEFEIARMIGGSEVTKLTIENAKEMIDLASELKKNVLK